MEQQLITKEFELTHRLISLVKDIASKTQLNVSWVFAALVLSGLKRADSGYKHSDCIFCITSGREVKESLARLGVCFSKDLEEKIKGIARMSNLNTDDGDLDTDEAVARLLILALTDREGEFKDILDTEEVDRLYLSNPELGIKARDLST